MPAFRYQALAADGAMQNGTITAPDRMTAMRLIQQKGETPLDVVMSEADAAAAAGGRVARPTISRAELADLVRELATALEAGLPLMQALKTVRRQAAHKNMQAILDFIIERVEAGVPFHTAAKEYGPPFDDMTTGMLRAADASGRTSEIMHQLADLLERSVELRREVTERAVAVDELVDLALGLDRRVRLVRARRRVEGTLDRRRRRRRLLRSGCRGCGRRARRRFGRGRLEGEPELESAEEVQPLV